MGIDTGLGQNHTPRSPVEFVVVGTNAWVKYLSVYSLVDTINYG